MTPLSQEFVDQCPVEDGFRLRGMDMTRIEVFVDAAFAFAVTMLVISFDAIPANWPEIILAIKNNPAFAAICLTFVLFYRYGARLRELLRLDESELFDTHTVADIWGEFAVIALISALVAIVLTPPWIPFAGFVYMLIGPWGFWWQHRHEKLKGLSGANPAGQA